ncbi:AIG2-like family protein [Colletotrichum karsti]|uniref:gamma-glutamylcyclotransferase n=1 Tax=Colletotrichum karsti TaxID=1095194 RepID=A0A9P6LKE8_9PEZI|nr:AIG2-like family protein [Colletotrichum karsti]KAF9875537.1 AIG2-like family protein [Colletotrichum karsti]
MSTTNTTLYFAYGSNLSPTQMTDRCPSSPPLGLAHLPGYTFIISTRRYANVVQNPTTSAPGSDDPGVYGVLYALDPDDEAVLDGYEGVPDAYTKEYMLVDVLEASLPEPALGGNSAPKTAAGPVLRKTKSVNALVYIDRLRTEHSQPWPEYVFRMNRGVQEAAAQFGLPAAYVEDVIRKWIPAPETPPVDAAAAAEEDPGLV